MVRLTVRMALFLPSAAMARNRSLGNSCIPLMITISYKEKLMQIFRLQPILISIPGAGLYEDSHFYRGLQRGKDH
jgi:hypothetical protein